MTDKLTLDALKALGWQISPEGGILGGQAQAPGRLAGARAILKGLGGLARGSPGTAALAPTPSLGGTIVRGLGKGIPVLGGASILGPIAAHELEQTHQGQMREYPGAEAMLGAGYQPATLAEQLAWVLNPPPEFYQGGSLEAASRSFPMWTGGDEAKARALTQGWEPQAPGQFINVLGEGAATPEVAGGLGLPSVGKPGPGKGWDFSGLEKTLSEAEAARQAAADRFAGMRPEGAERPKGEEINRFLMGLAGGAASVGDTPWNIGRTLAAAGASGLGELSALSGEKREEETALRREQMMFERELAGMDVEAAQQRGREAMLVERAKMDDYNNRAQLAMAEYQARLGARSIYYDPSTGMAIMTDKATGEVKTEQVTPIPLLLAQMKMMKAMGADTVDLYNAAGKKFTLDPVQFPAQTFAMLLANGYTKSPVESVDAAILEQMKANDPDTYEILQASLLQNDASAMAKMQELRFHYGANMALRLIESGRGEEVSKAINDVFKNNQQSATTLLEEMSRVGVLPQPPSRTR